MHDAGGKSKPKWPCDSTVSAIYSDCGYYRYRLNETWNKAKPCVMFLMMNPSVAGVEHSDPTLRRTGAFARSWGYGSQLVGNVHAYRATDSKQLLSAADPVGPMNDEALMVMAGMSEIAVLAYGQPPKPLRQRAFNVVNMLRKSGVHLAYLKLANDGTPMHPLYLPSHLYPTWYP